MKPSKPGPRSELILHLGESRQREVQHEFCCAKLLVIPASGRHRLCLETKVQQVSTGLLAYTNDDSDCQITEMGQIDENVSTDPEKHPAGTSARGSQGGKRMAEEMYMAPQSP